MRDIGRDQLLLELRSLQDHLQAKGIVHMALFGSRARGDHRLDSDIDLAVDIDDVARKFSLLDLIGVGHDIEDRIGPPANLFVTRSLDPEFQREIERERVVIF